MRQAILIVVAVAVLATVRTSFAETPISFFGITVDAPIKFADCPYNQAGTQTHRKPLPAAPCWVSGRPNPVAPPLVYGVVILPRNFSYNQSYLFGNSIGIELVNNKVQEITYQTRGAGMQDQAIQELTGQLGAPKSVGSKSIPNNVGPNVISKEVDWDVGDIHVHFTGAEETPAGHPGGGSVVVTTSLFRSVLEAREARTAP